MNTDYSSWLQWSIAITVSSAIASILLKAVIAVTIYRSAKMRFSTDASLRFFRPITWAFVGFVGGIFALALYWVMHYSTFTKDEK